MSAALALAGCTETVAVEDPVALELAVQAGGTPVTQAVGTFVPVQPAVRVTDAAGTPVADVRVRFAATRGGGSVAGGDVRTGADGIATLQSWRLGTRPGPQELVAAIVSATVDARVTFTATTVVGPTARLTVTPSIASITPGDSRQLVVNAYDAYDNVVGLGVAATFSSSDEAIATVSSGGLVTGVAVGVAVITASFSGTSIEARIGVGSRPIGGDVQFTAVADRPYGVAVSPTGRVYVARVDSPALARFDLPSTTAGAPVTMAGAAYDMAFLPDGSRAYAANPAGFVTVIDAMANAALRVVGGLQEVIRVEASADGAYVYASTTTGLVHRISTANDAVTTLAVSGVLNGLTINPARNVLYVSSVFDGALTEIDLATFTVARTRSLGGTGQGIAVTPDGGTVFVANEAFGVQRLDAATLTLQETRSELTNAFDVMVTLDGLDLYVARPGSGRVSVVNALTFSPQSEIVGGNPRRFGVSADGQTIVVANEANLVTFIR